MKNKQEIKRQNKPKKKKGREKKRESILHTRTRIYISRGKILPVHFHLRKKVFVIFW